MAEGRRGLRLAAGGGVALAAELELEAVRWWPELERLLLSRRASQPLTWRLVREPYAPRSSSSARQMQIRGMEGIARGEEGTQGGLEDSVNGGAERAVGRRGASPSTAKEGSPAFRAVLAAFPPWKSPG